jgi:TolB-like protein/AraC-like DNA-binding protein
MAGTETTESDFLIQVTALIEKNISNEQFGVSELAEEMNMSRSNLLRKVKKETELSVSQLISQVRLKKAMDLLKKGSVNVSEVSHEVGFNSTSYFIKCFREYYGYPPGEVGKRVQQPEAVSVPVGSLPDDEPPTWKSLWRVAALALIAIAIGFAAYAFWPASATSNIEKSIAVLPFKNDSNDSTNVYLINGLMESTLTNLQRMQDLKVTSRTSVEKYRNTSKSIPEMAQELKVSYFVEGSGQKIGDQILLNIQLIDGRNDKHLWAKQYRREVKDIFELQQEIAKNIAEEIKVVITPDEEKRITKKPTENVEAYDLYLKAHDLFYQSTGESLRASVPFFLQAIEKDDKFSLAYANLAMVYYYLDVFTLDKKYTDEINELSDKAMLYDPNLSESLIAKALSYAGKHEYKQAVLFFEKAFKDDPNSGIVVHFLTEFYAIHVADPAKYLEYALHGVRLIIPEQDSATASFKYFHLSNALIQSGFVDEGIRYVDLAHSYKPDGPFVRYVRPLFHFAKHKDYKLTLEAVTKEWLKDTTRVDIVKEVARLHYCVGDFPSAYKHYKKLLELMEIQHLDLYRNDYLTMAVVYRKVGQGKKADEFLKKFKGYMDEDETIYKNLQLGMYYAHLGDTKKSLEHLKLFSKEDNFVYWALLLKDDPIVEPMKDNPEFKKVVNDIETNFWKRHEQTKKMLEEKELALPGVSK